MTSKTDTDKKKSKLTWFHFSDLHLCKPETGWDAGYILEKLQQDFKTLQTEENLRPDLIFFTGDVVLGHLGEDDAKSITEQFDEAAALFDGIRESFDPPVPKKNFFIVPGNHDVNRGEVTGNLDRLKGKSDEEIQMDLAALMRSKNKEWRSYMDRLEDFRQFLERHGYDHLLEDRERMIYGVTRKINGINVGIGGMNSAWYSGKESKDAGAEKGKLWLAGNFQIQRLSSLLNNAELKIALMHHPFNWFNPAEDPGLKNNLSNHFKFFLHGHEHLDWVEEYSDGFTSIAAGASYGDSENEMGYSIVQLKSKKSRPTIWLRKFDSASDAWIPRVIENKTDKNGMWNPKKEALPLPTPPAKPKPKPKAKPKPEAPKVKLSRPKDGKVILPTTEAPPPIITDPPESRGVYGRQNDIEKIAIALRKTPLIVVCGPSGVGKSTLIEEVRRTQKDITPFTAAITKDMDLQALFLQLAGPLGCSETAPQVKFEVLFGKYDFSILNKYAKLSEPAFIHLTDSHYLISKNSDRETAMKEFLVSLRNYYPKTKVILESDAPLKSKLFAKQCEEFRIKAVDLDSVQEKGDLQ